MPLPARESNDTLIIFSLPFSGGKILKDGWDSAYNKTQNVLMEVFAVSGGTPTTSATWTSHPNADSVLLVRNPVTLAKSILNRGVPFFEDCRKYVVGWRNLDKKMQVSCYIDFWTRNVLYYRPRIIKAESFVRFKDESGEEVNNMVINELSTLLGYKE